MENLKIGDEVKLHGDKSEKIYYFIEAMDDGNIKLSDNKNELVFGNKFIQPIWIKRIDA